MPMLNRDNIDAIRQKTVINDIRKSPHRACSDFSIENRPGLWILLNAFELVKKLAKEFLTQSCTLVFIPLVRVVASWTDSSRKSSGRVIVGA
jgi:hypothetical protein